MISATTTPTRKIDLPPVENSPAPTAETAQVCPIHHAENGEWHIYSHAVARNILRQDSKQLGFGAELLSKMPNYMKPPLLYQNGEYHLQNRRELARFFTPVTVREKYGVFMEECAASIVAKLQKEKRANLHDLTLIMSSHVAARVIGLTSSDSTAMAGHLAELMQIDLDHLSANSIFNIRVNYHLAMFYFFHVLPAIRAHKRQPQDDVMSHMLAKGYKNSDILGECIMYGAAGVATTREFLCTAVWYFLENPALREEYLHAPEEQRRKVLHEILRLEPVVSLLARRTTEENEYVTPDGNVTIPAGSAVKLFVHSVNADPALVGQDGESFCPARTMPGKVSDSVISFGDGSHRCVGEFLALQESDAFLLRFLAQPTLRIEGTPHLYWNGTIGGYEVEKFIVTV